MTKTTNKQEIIKFVNRVTFQDFLRLQSTDGKKGKHYSWPKIYRYSLGIVV